MDFPDASIYDLHRYSIYALCLQIGLGTQARASIERDYANRLWIGVVDSLS